MGSGSGGTAKLDESLACFQPLEVMFWEQNPNRPRSSYPWINPGCYPLGKMNYRLLGPEKILSVKRLRHSWPLRGHDAERLSHRL